MPKNNKDKLQSPRVTVVSVTFNDYKGLDNTVNSVVQQDYNNYQYIIIDGGSTDGSINVIKSYNYNIDYWVSEDDINVYHAMNKAIGYADGEWILFMNSGDVFFNNSSLRLAMSKVEKDIDVIFADWIYAISNEKIKADKIKMYVRHQSVIYRKSLHNIYGTYVVAKNITISDYIFFLSITACVLAISANLSSPAWKNFA